MYRYLIKPIMFCFEPETAHFIAMRLLDILSKYGISRFLMQQLIIGKIKNNNPVHVAGLTFPNAVGLAAGFDKNAKHIDALALLGFGFIEIGTVTPLPQPGNPKPRLFRLVKDSAIINRMGFNNEGAEAVLNNLKRRRNKKILIGGNLGKNKGTPNEEAVQDYIKCFDLLYNEVDYFVVNVSSPNTPGLRALQDKKPLMDILSVLMQRNRSKGHPKPLFLKIAPDLNESQLIDIVEIARTTEIQGIIATNTTISREHLRTSQQTLEQIGAGGLSGLPLKERSTNVIQFLRSRLPKPFVIIGVGGIHSVKDALEKKQAGADLVQIYTGLIYEGPSLIAQIANRF